MPFELTLKDTVTRAEVFEGASAMVSLRCHVRKHVLDEKERWAQLLGFDHTGFTRLLGQLKQIQPNCDDQICPHCDVFARCTQLVEEVERCYQRRLQAAIVQAASRPRYTDHDEPSKRHMYFVDETGVFVCCKAWPERRSRNDPPNRLWAKTGFRPIYPVFRGQKTNADFFKSAKLHVFKKVGPFTTPPYYIHETWWGADR